MSRLLLSFLLWLWLMVPHLSQAQTATWQQVVAPTFERGNVSANTTPQSNMRTVATDASGNVYVAGTFSGKLTFKAGLVLETAAGAGQAMFVGKWNTAASTWDWVVRNGGTNTITPFAITVANNRVYVTGYFNNATTIGNTSLTAGGSDDYNMFLAMFNATDGSVGWALSGGSDHILYNGDLSAGSSSDAGLAVAVEGTNVYVGGYFSNTAMIAGKTLVAAGTAPNVNSLNDLFVAKYIDQGTSAQGVWAVGAGSTGTDRIQGLDVSGSDLYVAGYYVNNPSSYTGQLTIGNTLPNTGNSNDAFVAKFTDAGTTANGVWATSINNAAGQDQMQGVAVSGGNVYVTGYFYGASATLNGTNSTSKSLSGGFSTGTNAFVARYTPTGTIAWATTNTANGGASQGLGVATDGSNGVYVTGYYTNSITLANTPLSGTGVDIFVAKYVDQTTSVDNGWALGGGSASQDQGVSIALAGNSAWVSGYIQGASTFGNLSAGSATTPQQLQFPILLKSGPSGNAAPTVVTATPTGITTSGATLGGNVTSDGGTTINGRGVVYSSSNTNPTVGAANTTTYPNNSGTATFSANTTNLTPGTSYSVVAYASNSVGTRYGSVITFTTRPNAPVLNTPTIGTQLNNRRPTLSGTAQPGSTVTVYLNNNNIGTATGGNFTFTPTTDIPDGAYTAYATATVNGTAISANSNINSFTIDATAPTVGSFASTAGAPGGNAAISPFPFSITFSESVTGLSASSIQVTNGSVTSGPTGSGSGPYTFEVTPNTPNMATSVQLLANAARDAAGNGNTASSTYTLTYQPPVTAAPVVNTPPNNALVNTRTPTYSGTAPASSTVTVYVNANSVGTIIAANGQFSLTPPTPLADGIYSVSASAQSSGQQISANSNVNTFTVDATAPVVTSVTGPANGTYRAGQTLSFTVTYSEPVTVVGTPQLGLTVGTTSRQAIYSGGSGTLVLSFQYLIPSGDEDTDGLALATALTPNGGTLRDAAGNDATLTLTNVAATTGVLVDGVAPTVVSITRLDRNPTNAGSLRFQLTFSEPVTLAPSRLSVVATGSASGSFYTLANGASSGPSRVWTATFVAVSGNGTLRLDVNTGSGVIADGAGNPLSGGFATGEVYTIDQTAPSVVITSSAGTAGNQTANMPISFTITFSESITGLSAANVSVSNGTIGGFTMNSSSSYSFDVTPQANGPVAVSLAAGVTRDGAGNANTVASPYQITYRPPVTLGTLVVSPSAVCAGSSFSVAASIGRDQGAYSYTLTYAGSTLTGTTPNAFSQTLTAIGSGQQTLSLRVSNGVDDASQSSFVTVNPLPTVSLSNNGPLTCARPSVTLTAQGNGMGQALTYRFSAPATQQGGSSGNLATVTTAGDYSVTATTTSGCSATASVGVGSNFSLPTPTLLTQGGQSAVTVDLNTPPIQLIVGGCSGTASWTGANGSSGTGTSIQVATNAAGRFVYQTRCQVGSCISEAASATVTVQGRLTVLLRDVDNYFDNNAVQPLIQVQNQGSGALAYSGLSLRYYLTVEGAAALSNLNVNYAQLGNGNVKLRYVPLTPAQPGAGGYVEVSFTDAAGTLAAGGNSGNIQLYFAKSDYSALDERDDYSYANVRDQLVATQRITAYYNGALIGGIEPAGTGTPGTPPSVSSLRALTESKNGPSATQINTFLEIRNEGTTPVNYSDLKARYYFTSDGNERLLVEVDQGNVTARLVKLPAAVSGADYYLEVSFTQGGQLAPGASTGTVRYRISKPEGGRFDQTNDYSYQEQPADRSQNPRVVVLLGGERVWGTPPSGAAARQVALIEPGTELSVRVLGNPVVGGVVEAEVTGAGGQPLSVQLSDMQGRILNRQGISAASATEHLKLSVEGSGATGLLLLQVNTPTQSRVVKILGSH